MRQFHSRACGSVVTLVVALGVTTLEGAPPKVIESVPANGATDVDPALREIRVTFDQDMNRASYSWVGGGPQYPATRGKPRWVSARTCVLPVVLKPNHEYRLSVNNQQFGNFRSKTGESAVPYPLSFKTGAGKGGNVTAPDEKEDAAEEAAQDPEPLEFALVDATGREIRSADYEGVPMAIMCGACWCGGCQQDARPFGELAAKFGPRGIQFVRSVSGDNELAAIDFQKHYRLPMIQLMDPNRAFEKRYNEDGWTFIMLVDRSGNVVYRANNPDFSTLSPRLEKLLGPPVDTKTVVRDGVSYMRATLEHTGEIAKAHPADRFPSLAAAPDGRLYLVFSSNRRGNNDVFLRVFDGKKWSDDRPVAATEADEYDPTVIVDSQKRAWICWTSNAGGKNYNVLLTSLDSTGKPGKAMQAADADDDVMHGRIVCDPKARIWCTYYRWRKMGRFSRDREVYVRRFDGKEWSPETQVSPTNVPDYEDHSEPTLVPYGDGVLIAWSWDYHQPKGYTQEAELPTVFLRPVGEDLKLGPVVHASGRSIDVTPAVAVDGKNRVWCAWDASDWDGKLGISRKSLRVCRRDPTARKPQSAHMLSPIVSNVCTPNLVVGPSGRVTAVWSQTEQGDRWVLCQADWDSDEARWAATRTVEAESNPRFPSATYDPKGTLWIAYSAQGRNGCEIRVKSISAEGADERASR